MEKNCSTNISTTSNDSRAAGYAASGGIDRILSHIALRDTLAPENSPVLSPDRKEEIMTIARAATYIFTAKFPDLFPRPIIADEPKTAPGLPAETSEFILTMLSEFVASYTLTNIYASVDRPYSEHHRARAADCVDTLRVLEVPISLL